MDNYTIVSKMIEECGTIEDYEKLCKAERDAFLRRVCSAGNVLDSDGFITRSIYGNRIYSIHFINGLVDIEPCVFP